MEQKTTIKLEEDLIKDVFLPSQIRVLEQILKGTTKGKDIAQALGISPYTVRNILYDSTGGEGGERSRMGISTKMDQLLGRKVERTGWALALITLGLAKVVRE